MPRFGMLLSLVLLGLAANASRPARAAVNEFPYEAVIEADEAYVRCGPGKNFYVTMKLARGQHVTVRRHDPGGWFMIDPPPGSFSLIRMEDVVQQGNVATVKRLEQGQASVRIGSSLDPAADSIFQRKLSSGERAEIMGEVMIPRKERQVPMFRIRPPRGEFRWIEGNDLAPLDPQIKQQLDSDPFSTPPQAREARRDQNHQPPTSGNSNQIASATGGRPTAKPVATTSGGATTGRIDGSAQQVVIPPVSFDPRGRLDQIDVQFRDMIQREPPTWNLAQIEQAYLELRRNPAAAGVAGQVDLRFSALSHYKQVKVEYDDYYRLVSATSQRDAQLAAVENSLAPQNSRPAIGPTPQGGWPAAASSGDTNYQTPVQTPAAPPPLSVPNYLPQSNSAPQSTFQGQSLQNGPTLGAPVPMPVENRPAASPAPASSSSDSATYSPNTGAPGPNSGNPGNPENSVQGQISPFAPVATDPIRADSGSPTVPSEMAPAQSPSPPQRTRTHTSQFGPSTTGQPSNAYSATSTSPAVTPQMPSNTGFAPTPGQTNPQQIQGYPPQNQAGGNAPPFASQQPGSQQPRSQQSGSSQSGQPGASQSQGGFPQSGAAAAAPAPALSPPRQVRPPGSPPLDGAGIVQRAAATSPNGPRHVLLAPNGRILAYLQPDRGINLDAFVGRAMGIMGFRAYRPELQTDLIVVRGMIPVRLVQP